jgi:peptidoglycan/LPS O-acetylase OafA/YrhL
MKNSAEGSSASPYDLSYRPEIDGLRAWAVGLVLLFHARAPYFSGGFVGVDVFFVISGYLITRLLARDLATGNFSIIRFYERRARRILPALTAVVIATMLVGAVVALPMSLEQLSISGLAALLFVANLRFWFESSNYFAPGAETDPFLHTWSLAVEEQFYIVFPIILWLLFRSFKGARRALIATISVGLVSSLILAQIGTAIAPTATFYLFPTRAWELLVGSLLALNCCQPIRRKLIANIVMALGLTLIVATALILEPQDRFPGLAAFPPVFGAAMVLYASQGPLSGKVRAMLTAKPILMTGLVSYSLYLLHWPVLVYAEHYVLNRPLSGIEAALCLGLAFLLSLLSYRFIEQPFRQSRVFRPTFRMVLGTASLSCVAGGLAIAGMATNGLAFRYPEMAAISYEPQSAKEKSARVAAKDDCFVSQIGARPVSGCLLNPGSENGAVTFLWGDSFADHYTAAIYQIAKSEGMDARILELVTSQCPPIIGYDPINLADCNRVNARALAEIKARGVKYVVLAANWHAYLMVNRITYVDIRRTVEQLQSDGLTVILVGQSPVFRFDYPDEAFLRSTLDAPDTRSAFSHSGVQLEINKRLSGIGDIFIDPSAPWCDGDRCQFHNDDGYLVSDYAHFTTIGATPVVRQILGVIGG